MDEFLEFLPQEELKLVKILRQLVFDCIPNISEKLSYNVPYYKKNKNICFIWPSSIMWGKNRSYDGVRFGFTSGNLLSDELGYLDKGDRKQVYWIDLQIITDRDIEILKTYLFEAQLVDDQFKKKK